MVSLNTLYDIPALMRWRKEVMEHVFGQEIDISLLISNRVYYEQHINDGSHFALVAEYDGMECGCGAVCFTDELPSPDNPSGHCAYLMNIYVREPFRCRGIAHSIIKRLIEEAETRGCGKIYLESTDDGKKVYSSLGFKDMPDMMKYYGPEI